jgi:hypothetical protein
MIKCPRCSSTEGIVAVEYRGAYDTISFQFKCKCGKIWKKSWGTRLPKAAKSRREEMRNVEIKPNLLQRLAEQRRKEEE